MFTVTMIFLGLALVGAITSAMGKCPLWVPVLCLCVVELLDHLPAK